jgi:hypothetical protein
LEPPPPSTTAILAGLAGTGTGVVAQALSIKIKETISKDMLNLVEVYEQNIFSIMS